MKKIIFTFIILFLITNFSLNAAELKYSISSDNLFSGSTGTIRLEAQGANNIQPSLPKVDGLRWENNISRGQYYINGKQSAYWENYFTVTKNEGEIIIPSFPVKLNQETKTTEPFTLKVVPREQIMLNISDAEQKSGKLSLDKIFFIKTKILNGNDRNTFYVGEEINLSIMFFYEQSSDIININYPQLDIPNVIFRTFKENSTNPKYAPVSETYHRINNFNYQSINFQTAFRPLSATKLNLHGTLEFIARLNNNQPYQGNLPITIDNAPEILPLPPVPADQNFLNVIGNGTISYALSSDDFQVANPVTLEIKVTSDNRIDSLKAPELKLADFRTYPPEISISNNNATIRYILIPLYARECDLSLTLSLFSPLSGKYTAFNFERKIPVKANNNLTATTNLPIDNPALIPPSAAVDDNSSTEAANAIPNNILYLQPINPQNYVKLPLYRNYYIWYIILIAGGLLILIGTEVYYMLKSHRCDIGVNRRRELRIMRQLLLLKLHKINSQNELYHLINTDLIQYLNGFYNLPPGTSGHELIKHLNNHHLADLIELALNEQFNNTALEDKKMKSCHHQKVILKNVLKSLSLLLLLSFSIWSLPSFGSDAPTSSTVSSNTSPLIATDTDAQKAYDRGDFAQSSQFYLKAINPTEPRIDYLYNLGCALTQMKDYSGALQAFNSAHLLEPYNSNILENLNFVRSKLFLPPLHTVNSPAELWSYTLSYLRPDQWALVAAAGFFIICISVALRRKFRASYIISSSLAGLIIMSWGLAASVINNNSIYAPDNAWVIQPDAPLYSLPSAKSNKIEQNIPAFEKVKILEHRSNFVRINYKNNNIWIPESYIRYAFPADKIDLPLHNKIARL